MAKGAGTVIFKGETVNGATEKLNCPGYNAVIIKHTMTGQTTGGFVSAAMAEKPDGVFVAHHGEGTNISASAQAANYTAIIKGIMDHLEFTLNATDGTHTVVVQPVNIY